MTVHLNNKAIGQNTVTIFYFLIRGDIKNDNMPICCIYILHQETVKKLPFTYS